MARTPFCELLIGRIKTSRRACLAMSSDFASVSIKLSEMAFAPFCVLSFSHGAERALPRTAEVI
jgi:hypothetical protein